MKKRSLLIISLFLASGILYYAKMPIAKLASVRKFSAETYIKTPDRKIASYNSTKDELKRAHLENISNNQTEKFDDPIEKLAGRKIPIRNKRILIGESAEYYENENNDLEMGNQLNPDWKKQLAQNLLYLQNPDTKVIIKEEYPIIRVEDKKGYFIEQVVITFISKNGDKSSYRAYVDSESGKVLDTWDKMVQENTFKKRDPIELVPLEDGFAK